MRSSRLSDPIMTAPLQSPRFAAYDNAGAPLVGGRLYTMQSGSSTPKAAFTDAALSIAHTTNPIVLNARGEASVWLGPGAYRLRLTDSSDRVMWDVDGVTGPEALGTAKTLTDALRDEYASDAAGKGASLVALRDPSSKWAATNLEELAGEVDSRLSTLAIAQAGHGSRLSTAEGVLGEHDTRLDVLEAAAALEAPAAFTPVLTGGAQAGTVTLAGKVARSGHLAVWSVTITPAGGGSWSSAAGTTKISGLPVSPSFPAAFSCTFANGEDSGTGVVTTAGEIQPCTLTTKTAPMVLSGSFIIA